MDLNSETQSCVAPSFSPSWADLVVVISSISMICPQNIACLNFKLLIWSFKTLFLSWTLLLASSSCAMRSFAVANTLSTSDFGTTTSGTSFNLLNGCSLDVSVVVHVVGCEISTRARVELSDCSLCSRKDHRRFSFFRCVFICIITLVLVSHHIYYVSSLILKFWKRLRRHE